MNYLLTNEETERLNFRKVTIDDYNTWLPLFNEQHIAKYLGMPKGLTQNEQCDFWFKKVFHRYEHNLGGMNALIDKKTQHFIGQAGLLVQTIDNEERLEIGYSILPRYWNLGYATEAAAICKSFGFENNLADSLVSMMHIDNIGSELVALKNGMSLEKHVDDFKVYSITKTQWLEQKNH